MKHMNGISGYIQLIFGVILTSAGWVTNLLPGLKALSIFVGIVVMAISGWQIYQKGRLQKRQRKDIENGRKKDGYD